MDALAQRRRLVLGVAAAVVLAAAACGGAASTPVGVSTAKPWAHSTDAPNDAGSVAPTRSPLPADYAKTFRKVGGPLASLGHAPGRYGVTVYESDAAASVFEARHTPFPTAAVLIAEHTERAGNEARRGPTFMMEKTAASGDAGASWRFVAVEANGQVAYDGAGGLCLDCHRDAPHDGVFPLVSAAATAPATP